MMKLVEALWATAPDWRPIPYTEDDSDPTEPAPPPTLPSVLSAEASWELAQTALESGNYESAKGYMQYYNHKTREL
jgi:hypothetical protein